MSTTSYIQYALRKNKELAEYLGWRYMACSESNSHLKAWQSSDGKWQQEPQWAQHNSDAFSLMVQYECYPVTSVKLGHVCVATGMDNPAFIFVASDEHPTSDAAVRIAIIDAVIAKLQSLKKLTYDKSVMPSNLGMSEREAEDLLSKFIRGEISVDIDQVDHIWSEAESIMLKEKLSKMFGFKLKPY